MTVVLEHLPCGQCGQNTPQLRHGVNHALHLIATLVTAGLWGFGWLIAGLTLDRTTYCIRCGTQRLPA